MKKINFGKLNKKNLEKADELCNKALEIPNPAKSLSLLKEALKLSEYCSQAYFSLGLQSEKEKDSIEYQYLALISEEKKLGEKFFEENKGYFWEILETRVYMFMKFRFCEILWEFGYRESAVKHALELIELNTNDNQGMRYRLTGWLVWLGDKKNFNKLIKQFKGEDYCGFYFDQALFHFKYGNLEKAAEFLDLGVERNSLVIELLLGIEEVQGIPEVMSFGDDNEAFNYMINNRDVWECTGGSLEWLWSEYKKRDGKESFLPFD
ncbi:MAG: hypothetical protein KBF12_13980 [Sebaldella sp.]|nr:hypothetical protein [Sebaldella sp.]